jgi:hypothetical protein
MTVGTAEMHFSTRTARRNRRKDKGRDPISAFLPAFFASFAPFAFNFLGLGHRSHGNLDGKRSRMG